MLTQQGQQHPPLGSGPGSQVDALARHGAADDGVASGQGGMPPTMVDMTEPSTPGTGRLLTLDEGSEFGARAARHLRDDPVLWLTTVAPSGAPSPNPVWFLWDQASTVQIFSLPDAARVRHLATNPRVALHFDGDGQGGDIIVLSATAAVRPGEPGRGCRVPDQVRPTHRTDRSDPDDVRPEVLRADRGDLDPAGPLTRPTTARPSWGPPRGRCLERAPAPAPRVPITATPSEDSAEHARIAEEARREADDAGAGAKERAVTYPAASLTEVKKLVSNVRSAPQQAQQRWGQRRFVDAGSQLLRRRGEHVESSGPGLSPERRRALGR